MTGTPSKTTVTFGNFNGDGHETPAWLVVLDDVQPPQSQPASGRSVTRVVVDAEKGIVLRLAFATGI